MSVELFDDVKRQMTAAGSPSDGANLDGMSIDFGAGDDLDAVAARLGDDYIDDRNGHALRPDYGLVEFYWDWSTAVLRRSAVAAGESL